MSNVPEQNNDLAQTLARLTDRLDHIEIQLQQSTRDPTSSPMETTSTSEQETTNEVHSAITERLPNTEFHPYPEFKEHLTGFRKDFFRSPLPEVERRKFLAGCPRNVEREYNPPTLNTVNMASNNRRFDSQLSDSPFRLSGITRPLDLFLHQTLQQEQTTSQTIFSDPDQKERRLNPISFTISCRVYARLVDCHSISSGADIPSRCALTFSALAF